MCVIHAIIEGNLNDKIKHISDRQIRSRIFNLQNSYIRSICSILYIQTVFFCIFHQPHHKPWKKIPYVQIRMKIPAQVQLSKTKIKNLLSIVQQNHVGTSSN